MSGPVALTGLTALLALAGCFQLNLDNADDSCRLVCMRNEGCPGNFKCLVNNPVTGQGLCASPGTAMCQLVTGPGMDASVARTDAGRTDASVDRMEAGADRMEAGGNDAEAGTSGPPSMLCHNGTCLTLPPDVRANLVLLLWPSNLPAVGSTVDTWNDQSGQGNNAHALYETALPQVIPDGVHLDPTTLGSGFVVLDSPSLDFGSGDFALIVVAGLASSTNPVTILSKSDGARENSRRISIEWTLSSALTGRPEGTVDDTTLLASTDTPQPSVGAYALYRAADHVELHLNGSVLTSADLPVANQSTSNAENVYVGVTGLNAIPVDSIEAVIAMRGSIDSTNLNELELFLNTVLDVGPK